jgi:TPR repeat protein
LRQAAELGRKETQFNLGVLYADGTGVKQDMAEAIKWYRKAAAQGFADAKHNLDVALNPKPQQTGGYSGSSSGETQIDPAIAKKAQQDAEFRKKVENVQRQIAEIDRQIGYQQQDRQNAIRKMPNASDKMNALLPLEHTKSDYEKIIKRAEEKIRDFEKDKNRLLDSLK